MAAPHADRRLTAVLAADVVGFARLMERDEDGTLARLKAHRKELAEPLIAEYRGRTVKLMGDGALCEFASVVDAVRCAVLIQRGMAERERGIPETQRIRFRIGINLGDVIHEDDGDLYGDGVNVAARLRAAGRARAASSFPARPSIICRASSTCRSSSSGEQQVKNIDRPVRAYRVRLSGTPFHRLPSARRLWSSRPRAYSRCFAWPAAGGSGRGHAGRPEAADRRASIRQPQRARRATSIWRTASRAT